MARRGSTVRSVLDTRALQVSDVDELRAALIGRRGGRKRLLLEADE
jgi:hypothetical protein